MDTTSDMNTVVRAVMQARSLAIETLRQLYPDLYELSARAFSAGPAGGPFHHQRLGEFLTEWNNALGQSPIQALAMGRVLKVEALLAGRAPPYEC
ncbi:hypothetical protein [Dokdonella sp.]|uniref:hypothetical protein n=1 Tax=Dokdonella sp. TaxID=2291710 RepID=UPI0025C2FD5F|nr:hypothetical protein [Dokdonella sp.]MBX3691736.1 hypothetical protein [Dokdonella sp.]